MTEKSEILQQVRVIDPVSGIDRVMDVSIVDDRITAMVDRLEEIPSGVKVTDGRGLILGPGLVDLYSRTGEPGFEERETLESLQRSAVAGGYTRLTLLPETVPPLDTPAGLAQVRHRARTTVSPKPHCRFWGGLTCNLDGKQMAELADLVAAGAVGFTDGRPIDDGVLMRRVLEYAQIWDKPIALYPKRSDLVGDGVAREGVDSLRLGLPGIPVMAETSALAALLECVAETNTPVHVMRVSTARGVEAIRSAKEKLLPVTASTPWTHLLWDTTDLENYDPNLRLDPPLGTPLDRAALVDGVKSGTIDAIAIDHTPYTYEEKTVAFSEAPAGVIGLQYSFAMLWHRLVASGDWTPMDLWQATSTRPARCLQQPPPGVAVGERAELLLFDPQNPRTVEASEIYSRSRNTPLLGVFLGGQIVRTWCSIDSLEPL
ncbi:MAG: dihydroorotase [Cyanobacteria bacterium SID2]|nr:dihydroorotase [Cyanobacteria bacterium SID2]MBP0002735.1 dihydroorotase [Cyanobacteria bacterium SBC]